MFRIRFTADDLARTRIVPSYGQYAEALFGLGVLADRRRSGALFGGWRQGVGRTSHDWARPLGRLIRLDPVLDLFTLVGRVGSADEGIQELLSIGRADLRAEIDAAVHWAATAGPGVARALPSWVFRLPDDREVRATFAAAVHSCCVSAISPHWSSIQRHLEAEAAVLTRRIAEHGVAHLLDTLHAHMRWYDGVLCVSEPSHVCSQLAAQVFAPTDVVANSTGSDVYLSGRGLTLVPSVFCRRITPYLSVADPDAPAVLFYPALREVTDAYRLWTRVPQASTQKALAALLGTTRAAALEVLAQPRTTTELARRLGVSPATASHHATVLRDAGLISSRRRGGAVLHAVSPLGLLLLNGGRKS